MSGRHRRKQPLIPPALLGAAGSGVVLLLAAGVLVQPVVAAPTIPVPPIAAMTFPPTPTGPRAQLAPGTASAPSAAATTVAATPTPPAATPTTAPRSTRTSTTPRLPAATTAAPQRVVSTTRPVPAPTQSTTAPPAATPARAAAPPPTPARDCPATLDGTRGHVARAGYHLANRFGIPTSSIGGVAQRAGASDHPAGYALDFMVGRAVGDDLAAYALAHREELAVTYVIWRQRYNDGSGWDAMDDRGTATANHMDHVHISFGRTPPPGGGLPC